jgi:hypothetical protein
LKEEEEEGEKGEHEQRKHCVKTESVFCVCVWFGFDVISTVFVWLGCSCSFLVLGHCTNK